MEASASCSCGAFQLVVSAPPVAQLVCHCSECQTFSGQAFVNAAFFKKSDCRMTGQTRVETLVGGTGAEKLHYSCDSCGEPVYVQVKALNGAIAVMSDKLSPFEFTAEAHIWTGQKAAGTEIPSELLQSAGAPPQEIVERMINGFWK
jgi:hypothetical protein